MLINIPRETLELHQFKQTGSVIVENLHVLNWVMGNVYL